jgi:hypothetical protein
VRGLDELLWRGLLLIWKRLFFEELGLLVLVEFEKEETWVDRGIGVEFKIV